MIFGSAALLWRATRHLRCGGCGTTAETELTIVILGACRLGTVEVDEPRARPIFFVADAMPLEGRVDLAPAGARSAQLRDVTRRGGAAFAERFGAPKTLFERSETLDEFWMTEFWTEVTRASIFALAFADDAAADVFAPR